MYLVSSAQMNMLHCHRRSSGIVEKKLIHFCKTRTLIDKHWNTASLCPNHMASTRASATIDGVRTQIQTGWRHIAAVDKRWFSRSSSASE
jgi:hypothetical protein